MERVEAICGSLDKATASTLLGGAVAGLSAPSSDSEDLGPSRAPGTYR